MTTLSQYQAGLHLLVEFSSLNHEKMKDAESLRRYWDEQITQHDLKKVGEVYHSFLDAGFTATVCLTESHMAIHTWPEYGFATVDIYLSNFSRNNDEKVEMLMKGTLDHFEGTVLSKNALKR